MNDRPRHPLDNVLADTAAASQIYDACDSTHVAQALSLLQNGQIIVSAFARPTARQVAASCRSRDVNGVCIMVFHGLQRLAGKMRSRGRISHVAGFSHLHRMGVALAASKK
jgi:hypothetical protein